MATFNIPNFVQRRLKEKPVEFVEPKDVFVPMVAVVAKKDISGWASRERRKKWAMQANHKYIIDRQTAKEFMIKDYVWGDPRMLEGVSESEKSEILSHVTVISMGGGS